MVYLRVVENDRDWHDFLNLPYRLYRHTPCWVAPFNAEIRNRLDADKHPFYRHARRQVFLVGTANETLGRIVGIIDDAYEAYHRDKVAFFGFYEAADRADVAACLLNAVIQWAKDNHKHRLIGPMNPSTNYECGLLIDGYGQPPTVMMTYNHPYYQTHLESSGLTKAIDLFAYDVPLAPLHLDSSVLRQADQLRRNPRIRLRPLNLRSFDEEVGVLQSLYNDAWSDNWGFVPLGKDEFSHILYELKPFIRPDLCPIAEVDQQPAAITIVLPDLNEVFRKIGGGDLTLLKRLRLLWSLSKPGLRAVSRTRFLVLGIRKQYRSLRLGPLLYQHCLEHQARLGYRTTEASWILESNGPMNKVLQEYLGAVRTKTYRIFERTLQ